MSAGIPYEDARKRYHPGATPTVRSDDSSIDELLRSYHPDHGPNARVPLAVGVNRGEPCQPDLARHLQANALIDDVDLAGAQLMTTDVLIIGGGGGGCAAALTAAKQGARVILATKLRLGDSNTVMAEGGIQAQLGGEIRPCTRSAQRGRAQRVGSATPAARNASARSRHLLQAAQWTPAAVGRRQETV